MAPWVEDHSGGADIRCQTHVTNKGLNAFFQHIFLRRRRSETILADKPISDVIVAVHASATGTLGIVGMYSNQVGDTHLPVELGNHFLDSRSCRQVIASSEAMLRVQTYSQPRVVHSIHDTPQVLELGANVLAHASHILQRQARTLGRTL